MSPLPGTTPVPPHIFMPQVSAVPTPSPIPIPKKEPGESKAKDLSPSPQAIFPLPKLRLEVRDLNHNGSEVFLSSVVASQALAEAVRNVLRLLYVSPKTPTTTVPPTRSVTLILRDMGSGVAYTTGTELDSDHKEIHFHLGYINGIAKDRQKDEIMGVLTHEMVHCFQYDAFNTCPGGLVEGIADWVRLNSDLSPPHWKKDATGTWDAGYQHTGYFLQYLEDRFGPGLVQRANEKLRITKYEEKRYWTELCGRPVEQLWGDYAEALKKEEAKKEEEECVLVEKEDATTPKQADFNPSVLDEGPTPTTQNVGQGA